MSGISPILLLAIVILAGIFFLFGIFLLLMRHFMKSSSLSSVSQSNRFPDSSGSHALQSQLQHLFRLHDSGLDQSIIDTLPTFCYKDILGLKEPFDCAVCLCEFLEQDMLRLLPLCCHAFHTHCIDTWLLSNSTCPLCRGLIGSSFPVGSPLFSSDVSRNQWNGSLGEESSEGLSSQNPRTVQETGGDWRVFSVRLGKFRSFINGGERGVESSRWDLEGRRCLSMSSCQYVVGDSELQVALLHSDNGNGGTANRKPMRMNYGGKKISARTEGDSFSVSKIWLWSKKGKLSSSSDANVNGTSLNLGPNLGSNRTQIV